MGAWHSIPILADLRLLSSLSPQIDLLQLDISAQTWYTVIAISFQQSVTSWPLKADDYHTIPRLSGDVQLQEVYLRR